jgi:hypothetical protein
LKDWEEFERLGRVQKTWEEFKRLGKSLKDLGIV